MIPAVWDFKRTPESWHLELSSLMPSNAGPAHDPILVACREQLQLLTLRVNDVEKLMRASVQTPEGTRPQSNISPGARLEPSNLELHGALGLGALGTVNH